MNPQRRVEKVPFVDLKPQYDQLKQEIADKMSHVIERSAFIMGPELDEFEQAFADYCQVKYAVGVGSGTAALELIIRAYGLGDGDEVITTANTFIATALAVSSAGAKPVFVDIDPQTHNLDVEKAREAITPKTKAILPVHLYGQPADMEGIGELADKHDLLVIEDACQAHGARYKGRPVGGLGHAAAFSFYPSKNLGAFGDAGMVVTNDEAVAEKVRMYRNVGQSKKYHHDVKGHNHRLDNLQAAILGVKLPYLDDWNAARRKNAQLYNDLLADTDVITPLESEDVEGVYHLYVIRVNDRDGLRSYLAEKNIGTGIHYPVPIHRQPAYQQEAKHNGNDLMVTEQFADQILSLPMYAELTEEMIVHVVGAIRQFEMDRT